MARPKRLVDLIQGELEQLDNHQKNAFRDELRKELPGFIRKTARTIKAERDKPDKETLQVNQE